MGNDGGRYALKTSFTPSQSIKSKSLTNCTTSIPTRRELVREAARNPSTAQVKEAQREQQEHSWTTCPISHNQLMRPIVSDCVGNLYNKDAILRFLLPGDETDGISSKADCEEILCGRVKGLRDVVELKFEVDTEREAHPASGKQDKREGWICPVTAKQLGPNVKSVYLVPCGHVFSEEAIRQLKGDKCLQVCYTVLYHFFLGFLYACWWDRGLMSYSATSHTPPTM